MVIFDKPEELIHWLGQLLKKEKPHSEMSAGLVRVFDGLIEELMVYYGRTVRWDDERLEVLLSTAAEDPRPIRCTAKIIGFIVEVYSAAAEMGELDLEEAMRILFEFLDIRDDELRIVESSGERYVVSTTKFEAVNKLKVCFSFEQAYSRLERETAKMLASVP